MNTTGARIGCGAGFAADRIEPAVDLVERGRLNAIALECLGERTVSLAALRRLADPGGGFDPMLAKRVRPLLEPLARTGTRLVTNAGAANPLAAARMVRGLGADSGVRTSVAAVVGDDVLDRLDLSAPAWEDGRPLREHGEIVSANAYIGVDAILPALETGAGVVITGRAADPSLFLAPLMHELGWDPADRDRMAAGTLIGHLLECAGQVTGGYFADPGPKPVPGLARLGYPLAEVGADGTAVITKLPGTGGRVDRMTVVEQLTYEVTDPHAYLTPDVALDMTGVGVTDLGGDRVGVGGARGRARPERLKVSVGYRAGFRGEGEISYAGRGALERARLAADVVRERLSGALPRLRVDIAGLNSLHGDALAEGGEPYECRLRVAGLAGDLATAEIVGEEVSALYTSGPAGGGGVRAAATEVIGVLSSTVAREQVHTEVVVMDDTDDREEQGA
ncbi:hypothetical protein HDA32_003271 [Spinactinospora alkalitolerans]|uniref:Acyclic terpene utilisation N-terminal domain-containing protein n=1 Tax=Spinactinospora alkalitolerans TaxID=687207 RepID=A0A852TWQ2_9ACTN|nr:acyclic terpene utilization AtuA family protein [Spinactinospora alkalitolerans]NYE48151.1 hypothetical protein [Spinactinospora alkalitolerans]